MCYLKDKVVKKTNQSIWQSATWREYQKTELEIVNLDIKTTLSSIMIDQLVFEK